MNPELYMFKLLLKGLIPLLIINALVVVLISRPLGDRFLHKYVTLIQHSGNPDYTEQQPFYPEFTRLGTVESLDLTVLGHNSNIASSL